MYASQNKKGCFLVIKLESTCINGKEAVAKQPPFFFACCRQNKSISAGGKELLPAKDMITTFKEGSIQMATSGQSIYQAKQEIPRGIVATAILIYVYCGVRIISLLVGFLFAILYKSEVNIAATVINLIWTAAFLATGVDVLRCRKGGLLWGIILSLVIMAATVVFSALMGLDLINLAMLPLLTATVILLIIYRNKFTQPNKPLGTYFKPRKANDPNG